MPELTVIDVGHGSASALVGDDVVIVDAGPGSALLEYVLDADIDVIDALYVSHADKDHINGVIGLLGSGTVSVRSVWLNTDSEKDTETWRDLLYSLDDYHRRGELHFHIGLVEGHVCPSVAPHTIAEVVAPRHRLAGMGPGATDAEGLQITTNSVSAVIRITHRGKPVALLTGDLDATGLRHLLDAELDLDAPLLVFPHHGGHVTRGGTAEDDVAFASNLLDRVQPEVVVFSIGRGRYETPRPEIVEAIRRHSSSPRVACTQLSERCSATVPAEQPTHLTPRYAAGRALNRCCAGTVVVEFDSSGHRLHPDHGSHETFISLQAPGALCRAERPPESHA